MTFLSCNQTELSIVDKPNQIETAMAEKIITRKDLNLNGNVKSFIEYEFMPDDTLSSRKLNISETLEYKHLSADPLLDKIRAQNIITSNSILFKENGQSLTKVWWYRINGQADTRNNIFFKYDNDNRLIKKEEYIVHGAHEIGKLWEEQTFTYGKQGKLNYSCSKKYINSKVLNHCVKITYGGREIFVDGEEIELKSGDTTEVFNVVMNTNGVIMRNDKEILRELNKQGELTKTIRVHPISGAEIIQDLYTNDTQGNLIQETNYDREGLIWSNKNYIYNDGKLALSTDNDIDSWRREFFDKNGELQKTQDFHKIDSTLSYDETTYKYDTFTNLIARKMIFSDGKTSDKVFNDTYQYMYDENGNWIEMRSFSNDSLSNIKRREILYY